MRRFVEDVLAAMLPGLCPCGARGEPVCDRCAAALRNAPFAPPPPGVDWWVAPYAYDGAARDLIARAKYRGGRSTIAWLGRAIAGACPAQLEIDLVTWAPASTERRRANGVDHGELLARVVARELRLTLRRLLVRGAGLPQTGAGIRERRRGPELRALGPLEGRSVLVVDDVATTGATLSAAARVLRVGGAVSVAAAAAARTPRLAHA